MILRGKGLSDTLTDADPHKDNKPYAYTTAKEKKADLTVQVVNTFIRNMFSIF